MGFRSRRSVKLLPGVRLNFSTRGLSTSLGGRGATVNIGRNGARATVGLPGTGLSYTSRLFGRGRGVGPASPSATSPGSALLGWIVIAVLLLMLGMCALTRTATPATPPVQVSSLTPPPLATRTVSAHAVNCRSAPDRSGAVLATLEKGAAAAVVGQSAGWTKVARMGGDCWVSDSLLSGP